MTILVTGGTGRLGGALLPELRRAGRPTRVLTRSEAAAAALRAAGTEVVVGPVEAAAERTAAVAGCAVVISAMCGFGGRARASLRTVDRDGNAQLIEAAEAAGVRRFVLVSSSSAGPAARLELDRMKHAAEQALRRSTLEWIIVRSAPFWETQQEVMAAPLARKGRTLILGSASAPVSLVPVLTVAHAVVAAALGEGSGSVVDVVGIRTTPQAMSDALHAEAGTDGRAQHIPVAALRVMAIGARPFNPFLARAAGAALAMQGR